MNRKKKNNPSDANDEVEELLRAAQDEAFLKLTVDSHTVHASSSDLHPDLDQRFRNLITGSKSEAKLKPLAKEKTELGSTIVRGNVEDGDDLLMRFAALKASIPKPPTSMPSSLVENVPGCKSVGIDVIDDEEDEVEKVIRWAMDAARLDPSPPSGDDDDDDDDDVDNNDDNDNDDDDDADNDDDDDDDNDDSDKSEKAAKRPSRT